MDEEIPKFFMDVFADRPRNSGQTRIPIEEYCNLVGLGLAQIGIISIEAIPSLNAEERETLPDQEELYLSLFADFEYMFRRDRFEESGIEYLTFPYLPFVLIKWQSNILLMIPDELFGEARSFIVLLANMLRNKILDRGESNIQISYAGYLEGGSYMTQVYLGKSNNPIDNYSIKNPKTRMPPIRFSFSKMWDIDSMAPSSSSAAPTVGAPSIPTEFEAGLESKDQEYPVWFGTNRKNRTEPARPSFGILDSGQLQFGKCTVLIPKEHVIGEIEGNLFARFREQVGIKPDPEKLRLIETVLLDTQEFQNEMLRFRGGLPEGGKEALIFIHGFNNSFENAAIRTAQLGCDLRINGPVAFFSWPSANCLLGYWRDRKYSLASSDLCADFIIEFINNSGVDYAHIVAHSMGNRVLAACMKKVSARVSKPFRNIILAAPDIDKSTFMQMKTYFPGKANRVTLYISQRDLALWLSRIVNRNVRVGYWPPVVTDSDVETVSVGKIDLGLLGHGYIGDNKIVIGDLYQLVKEDKAVRKRYPIKIISQPGGRVYYSIQ